MIAGYGGSWGTGFFVMVGEMGYGLQIRGGMHFYGNNSRILRVR